MWTIQKFLESHKGLATLVQQPTMATRSSCMAVLADETPRPQQEDIRVCLLAPSSYRASGKALEQLSVGKLSPTQEKEFRALVNQFANVFAENKEFLGQTDVV